MRSVQLHERLVQAFGQIGLEATKPQRENLALLCQALAVSPNCHLTTLALGMPLSGSIERVIQRLGRFLTTEALEPRLCYRPMVRHLMRHWNGSEVNLVMDRTDIEDRWSILTVGAAYHKRVLPLAWKLLSFGGTGAEEQMGLLRVVRPLLDHLDAVRVHFYADAEFRAVPVQQLCQRYGWHWQIGLKSDLLFRQGDGPWQALREIAPRRGERRYLQALTVTQEHAFGPVNLIADWAPAQEAPRYWVLDQTANGDAWRRGRKRFWIEPTFRDWKSYGFDLEGSKLNDPHRLQVLLLAMAITTIWLLHLGERLLHTGRERSVTFHTKRDASLFRLGRDFIQRARTLNYKIPVGFTVQHGT